MVQQKLRLPSDSNSHQSRKQKRVLQVSRRRCCRRYRIIPLGWNCYPMQELEVGRFCTCRCTSRRAHLRQSCANHLGELTEELVNPIENEDKDAEATRERRIHHFFGSVMRSGLKEQKCSSIACSICRKGNVF